ncbi:unnamed protein product [Heligmosomoides polygyrus]|uniref:Propep_M14 domain-containing protein n=1 Tax=Heligmosomoides polygyrus TaxID=6339 RepID=A0A3P7ZUD8_HELPZ|nr:unnamed protein product [Heligmosomoides polygyrus]
MHIKFTVLRLKPATKSDVDFLHGLLMNDVKLDFWKSPTEPGREVHVMVDELEKKELIPALDARNITHSVMIDDVKKYGIVIAFRAYCAMQSQTGYGHLPPQAMDDLSFSGAPMSRLEHSWVKSSGPRISGMDAIAASNPNRRTVAPRTSIGAAEATVRMEGPCRDVAGMATFFGRLSCIVGNGGSWKDDVK